MVLLSVIQAGGNVSRLRLVKLMFLVSKDRSLSNRLHVYDFVPYKYGPFSFEMYHDLSGLERMGCVEEINESVHYLKGPSSGIDEETKMIVLTKMEELRSWDDSRLVREIYRAYPEYTIFSQIDQRMQYHRVQTGIVTIGYEGRTIDSFIMSLIENKVHLLMDVRRNPISRRYSFSKTRLKENLAKFDIEYEHLPQLGISSFERRGLEDIQDYQALFERYRNGLNENDSTIQRIIDISRTKKVALMCYEGDVRYCHRGVIAEFIRGRGIGVAEI